MAHFEATADVPVHADILWQAIRSFQGIGDWHPMLASVRGDGEQPGAIRTAVAEDGSEQVERLLEIDLVNRAYRYAMESSAMPVRDYRAHLGVQAKSDGISTVRWTRDFQVTTEDEEQTAGMVHTFLAAGVHSLAERYAG